MLGCSKSCWPIQLLDDQPDRPALQARPVKGRTAARKLETMYAFYIAARGLKHTGTEKVTNCTSEHNPSKETGGTGELEKHF